MRRTALEPPLSLSDIRDDHEQRLVRLAPLRLTQSLNRRSIERTTSDGVEGVGRIDSERAFAQTSGDIALSLGREPGGAHVVSLQVRHAEIVQSPP